MFNEDSIHKEIEWNCLFSLSNLLVICETGEFFKTDVFLCCNPQGGGNKIWRQNTSSRS